MRHLCRLISFAFALTTVVALGIPTDARAEKEKELFKTKAIRAIITPDGKSIVAAGDNVRLIDPVAKKSVVFRKTYARIVLSTEGKVLALIKQEETDKTDGVELIDLTTKKRQAQFSVSTKGHVASALSPGGKLFVHGGFKELYSIDTKTGKQVAEAKNLAGQPWSVSFSPDGKQIACGFTENKVILFEAEGLKPGHTIPMPDWVQSVAFTPDGKQLAASAGMTISLIDVASGKITGKLAGTKDKIVRSVAFGADGKVLASCDGMLVTLWDMATAKPLDTIKCPAEVFFLSLSTDAKMLTVSLEDNTAYLYDVSAATGAK